MNNSRDILRSMGRRDRLMLVLREAEKMSYKEIGMTLDIHVAEVERIYEAIAEEVKNYVRQYQYSEQSK